MQQTLNSELYFNFTVIYKYLIAWLRIFQTRIVKIRARKEEQNPNGFNEHVPLVCFHHLCTPVKSGEPYQGCQMINGYFLPRNLFGIHCIQTQPHELQGDTNNRNISSTTITKLCQLIDGYMAHKFQD